MNKNETKHVCDWLDDPPLNDTERDAKEWLGKFVMPAFEKHEKKINDWLDRFQVTTEWKGNRYICSGASRLGDVWLKSAESLNYYDHRVAVEECSNWKRISVRKRA